jgi:hypothetical protein
MTLRRRGDDKLFIFTHGQIANARRHQIFLQDVYALLSSVVEQAGECWRAR